MSACFIRCNFGLLRTLFGNYTTFAKLWRVRLQTFFAAWSILALCFADAAGAQAPQTKASDEAASASAEADRPAPNVTVASKAFTESVVLGEMMTHLARESGASVKHEVDLGGTQVVWAALINGAVDVYPEYTGTLRNETLEQFNIKNDDELRRVLLHNFNVRMSGPLGFDNSYALGMRKKPPQRSNTVAVTGASLGIAGLGLLILCGFAWLSRRRSSSDEENEGRSGRKVLRAVAALAFALGVSGAGLWIWGARQSGPNSQAEWDRIQSISDLRRHPELRFGLGNEFMARADGWDELKSAYRLPHEDVHGVEHELAYHGIETGTIDVMDLYTTDAEIEYYDLRTLDDDRRFFPKYEAVVLYRDDLASRAPKVVESILRMEGAIDQSTMRNLNAQSKIYGQPETVVAASFLEKSFGLHPEIRLETRSERLWRYTLEHLKLVGFSVVAAILVAIPLGVVAAKQPLLGHAVLGVTGIMQTVPSLALFVLLIPLLGLGAKPAICALFFYSLLPIVRNTHAGLSDIPRPIHESGQALGLSAWARLRLIELPMASRSILAGVKTAAVINVGTATLGGFIGAGGYGDPIFSGLRKNSHALLLEGAIPAALMALAVQGLFELAERKLVPLGLRLKAEA